MKKARIMENWEFREDGNEADKIKVELPHDAMILEKRNPKLPNGSASGYFPGGKYIYTRKIHGEEAYANRSVLVEFEGVYMNSTVYLNGEEVGGWIYGYTNFFIDLTGKLKIGADNELKVVVDNSKTPNSRWYTGSGIYRPVNLWTGNMCHILPEGVKIKTISLDPAVIQVSVDTSLEEYTEIEHTVFLNGKKVTATYGACVEITIPDAKLWCEQSPNLYMLKTELKRDGEILDEAQNDFGIRTLAWDAKRGFQVNGNTVKLRGGCIHHDHGILGACAYDKAEYRRVKRLKEFGFNAVRYAHNPAGKNFLKACDELGMYVLDETFDQWRRPKSTYDYSTTFDEEWEKDLRALVSKDYNHPCVIMYCIGNEIPDTGRLYGAQLAKTLSDTLHSLDDTRPTTNAINAMMTVIAGELSKREVEKNKPVGGIDINELMTSLPEITTSVNPDHLEELAGECFDAVDIMGYNYGHDLYQKTHELKPDRIILSSETFPKQMAANWKTVEQNSYCIGDFLWTAWDYLGEAGVGLPVYGTANAPFAKDYPCLTAACGSFDLTGYPEAQAYYEAVLWGVYDRPYIGVRPVNHSGEEYTLGKWRLTDALNNWTWEGCEGRKAEIEIYSKGKFLELWQDGVSLGKKKLEDCKVNFETEYRPGRLEAVSFDKNGEKIAESELVTAGKENCLRVLPEERELIASKEEIVFVPIHVTDESGLLKMMTDKKISVKVEGPGKLLALGSGRPETKERFSDGVYTSRQGRVLAVIKSNGQGGAIKVTACAKDMKSVSAVINVINDKEKY